MEGSGSEYMNNIIKTKEEIQRIVDKWKPILESNTPLSSCRAIIIESQENWHTEEDLDRATPSKI